MFQLGFTFRRNYRIFELIMGIVLESSSDAKIALYGGNKEAFMSREPIVILVGAAGTGKTLALCLKMHLYCTFYPGVKVLLCRKSLPSLRNSAVKTYQEVLEMTGMTDYVRVLGESRPTNFIYDYNENEVNGVLYKGKSEITLSQIDSKGKILGAQYDMIYVNQPDTDSLTELEFTQLFTRNRSPIGPYQQLLADPNPCASNHWLLKGMLEGKWNFFTSTHQDNPSYYNHETGEWTKQGKEHLARLELLPDHLKESQLHGRWYSIAGTIFEKEWNPKFVLTLADEEAQDLGISIFKDGEFIEYVPDWWDHYLAVDFGGTTENPFAAILIVHNPEEDKFIVYRHVYSGEKDIFECAELCQKMCEGVNLRAIIADRGKAESSVINRYLKMDIQTAKKGNNSVESSLNICAAQLNADKWRFLSTMESLYHEPDRELLEARKPMGLAEELPSIQRDEKTGGVAKKQADHAADAWRYFCRWWAEENGHKKKEKFAWISMSDYLTNEDY